MKKIEAQLAKGALRISATYQGEERARTFYRRSLVLGRANGTSQPDFDVSLDNTVSRSHARIWVEDGNCWIEDLTSKFGTKVDGEDIRGSGKVRIDGGSNIVLGGTTLQVESQVDNVSGFAELPPQSDSASPIEIDKTINTQAGNSVVPKTSTLDAIQRQTLLVEILIQFTLPAQLDQLLQTIIRRVVELIPGAKRGTLLLRNPATDGFLLAAFVSPNEPAVSETLARRALNLRQAFVWRNNFGSDYAQSIHRHQIQSGMYAPLIHDGRPLGALCVDNPECESAFSDEDLHLLTIVADHAAVAVSHHQLREELNEKTVLLEALFANLPPSARMDFLEKAKRTTGNPSENNRVTDNLQNQIQELGQN